MAPKQAGAAAPSGAASGPSPAEETAAREAGLPATLYGFVWRDSRHRQIALAVLTATIFPLSLAPLELQRRIVDNAIKAPDASLLIQLCGLYLGVVVLHGLLKFARNMVVGLIGERTVRKLRLRIADSAGLIEHPNAAAEATRERSTDHEGATVSMMSYEAERVGTFAGDAISQPLLQIGILVSVLGYMLTVDWKTALAALSVFVPAALLAPVVQRWINRCVQRKTALMRELGDVVTGEEEWHDDDDDLVDGPKRPRASHARRPEILTLDIMKARMAMYFYKYAFKFFNNMMGELGRLAVLFVGGWFVIQGEAEVGVIVAFLSGLEKVSDPAREMLNFYRQYSQTRVQYRLLRRAVVRAEGRMERLMASTP